LIPAWGLGTLTQRGTQGLDQHDVEESVEDRLLSGCRARQFSREETDGIVKWIVIGSWQMEYRGKRVDQLLSDIAGELISAAEKYGRVVVAGPLIVQAPNSEFLVGQTHRSRAVSDAVVGTTLDERHVARQELARNPWVVEPEPGVTLDDGMDSELDGAGQTEPPRGSYDRPGEDPTGGSGPYQVLLEHVHLESIAQELER
jgi:hypothetical protein